MANFTPRLSKPEAGNKYYNTRAVGGYSDAIVGKPTDPGCNVLSNCVGYAFGRFNEIGDYGYCKYLRPVNAENFIQYAGNLKVGLVPQLGACMVWKKGATLNNSDGAGHVAIVEQVLSPTQVVTSESGYNSAAFWTKGRSKGSGNWGMSSDYTFLGFIYNPAVTIPEATEPQVKPTQSSGNATSANTVDLSSLKVGDIVYFIGNNHYPSASAYSGPVCRPGKARITAIYPAGKHPVHLVRVDGGGGTVYGWVNAADIKVLTNPSATSKTDTMSTSSGYIPEVGDIVEFTGNCHYSNSMTNTTKSCVPGKAKVTLKSPGSKHPYHVIRVIGEGSTVYGWVDADTIKEAK